MAKEIKLSEEKYHKISILGTAAAIFTLSSKVGSAVDSISGGGERTTYVLEVDGKRHEFDTKDARDTAAKNVI